MKKNQFKKNKYKVTSKTNKNKWELFSLGQNMIRYFLRI